MHFSGSIATVLLVMMWGLGCAAEGVSSESIQVHPSNSKEDAINHVKNSVETLKNPLEFELLFSAEPELCNQYLEMLNKTKYMEYPSCKRKYLPEYTDFQEITWEEITDQKTKEDLVRWGVEQNIRATYSTGKSKESVDHSVNFTYNNLKAFLDKYEWHLYKTQMDMARDGASETMYKLEYSYPVSNDREKCNKTIEYFADDKNVKTPSEYRKKGYAHVDDSVFFYYKKNPYNENWSGIFTGSNDDEWWKSRGGKPSNLSINTPYIPVCKFRIKE